MRKKLTKQEKKLAAAALRSKKEKRRKIMAAFGLKWVGPALTAAKYLVLFLFFVILPLAAILIYALQCRHIESGWAPLRGWRYAHRGLHREGKPENSLAAFQDAIDHGYGVELDVHLMKDGKLAVVHDSHLGRMCGADVMIEELTAEDLPGLKLDYTDETIPLLEDVLKLFDGRPEPLIVELKVANGNYKELAQKTIELIDRYQVQFCIESFDPRAVAWFRNNRPEVIRGQLSTALTKPDHNTGGEKKMILLLVQFLFTNIIAQPDFIAYDFKERSVPTLWLCRKIYHVQEVSWTIRTPEDQKAAEALGNLVIFENYGW